MQDEIIVEDGKRWEFNDAVTTVFGEMLERSIPQYEVMRQLVHRIGSKYVKPNTRIVDIGCSRGDAIAPFIAEFKYENYYTLAYIDKMWGIMRREAFPEEIRL